MTDWTKPEPPPKQTGSAAVWLMVLKSLANGAEGYPRMGAERLVFMDACQQRHEMGVAKYGQALEVENGRNPLNDLRDEVLDAVVYSRQLYERTKGEGDWELHLLAVQFAARVLQRILKRQS